MNILAIKSFQFAKEVVILARMLRSLREFDFATQLFRAGTSIGANVEEAVGAQSRRDFIAKISIAHKEAREVRFWFNLIKESQIISSNNLSVADSLLTEILAIIIKTLKTAKSNLP